jgi:hypothetical protein
MFNLQDKYFWDKEFNGMRVNSKIGVAVFYFISLVLCGSQKTKQVHMSM